MNSMLTRISPIFYFYTIHDSMHTQMKPGTVDHFLKKYARLAYNSDPSFPINLHAHVLRHSIAMAMYKKGYSNFLHQRFSGT